MKLSQIISLLGPGERAPQADAQMEDREPSGYSIDSRAIRAGELFFAVRGEKHDGHAFVADALKKGAIGAVVSQEFMDSYQAEQPNHSNALLIPVGDTLAALQALAGATLKTWRGREVAITGSMGKTTTKEMTAAALARHGRVIKTTGNFNNAFGLPLSILRMESDGARASDFDFAVFEMGMSHKGEIAELTRIAPPDMGVVTNVAAVHLEFFPSIDLIAEAKAEMVAGVKAGGVAVLNADDERVARMRQMRSDIEFRLFGLTEAADVKASDVVASGFDGTRFNLVTPRGSVAAKLPLAGRHNIYNALAAAAAADFYETPLEAIAQAIGETSSPKMRGEIIRFGAGFTLVDDSYNSNPRALTEMVATLCASHRCERRIVVAGEMLELGVAGPELHREAGRRIAEAGIDLLIGVRGLASEIVAGAIETGMSAQSAIFCESSIEAADILAREARRGDLILVKGSRGVKTEVVVERMKQKWGLEVGA